VPRGFSPAKNFVAPRLGFAYDVYGNGNMAIRGGFGTFYERLRQNNFNFGAGAHWPNTTGYAVYFGNVATIQAAPSDYNPPITPQGFVIWPADNTMPHIYSWYVGVQRELPWQLTLDLSYLGNRDTHLMDQRYVNGVPAGMYVQYPNLLESVNYVTDALRPYYGWGGLGAVETLAYSSYNAMQLRLSRRLAGNLAFNVNYTWSKVMDLQDFDDSTINNPFDMRADWAPAGYDQTNVFTADFIYQFPSVMGSWDTAVLRAIFNGWQISGIVRSQSGMPISVTSNGDLAGVDAGTQYANLFGDAYAGQSQYVWLNPGAFRRPLDGQYGNTKRNEFRLPAINNVDATLAKSFKFTEGSNLTLRADFFNLFNHPQIWAINTGFSADNQGGGISSSNVSFGQPYQWRDMRVIQLGFRFEF
jgi:hypothetical protein